MGKKQNNKLFPIIQPSLQISFYNRLQTIRHLYLGEALSVTVQKLEIPQIDSELATFVGRKYLKIIASFGLRGEVFFPVPCLLRERPSLLGYYRLLCGISQKEFYRHNRISSFKRLEEKNELTKNLDSQLIDLCKSLVSTAQIMLDGIDDLSIQIIRDLQLLTLGAQLRGGQNTKLGKDATAEVFSIIEKLVHRNLVEEGTRKLILKNAAGRTVTVAFSSDPDISIIEDIPSGARPIVSIEIKGGTDVSNIHNRIGEAEKSHQKARSKGFFEFWTIIGTNVDISVAKRESPTTSRFFYLSDLRKSSSKKYEDFRNILQSVLGIRTAK
ncbi:MAG: XcyI family restriction endonuclease [Dehalococcoidales bacterium]|nr:XcyI family restriction endonuclease [Dehalococcoidales bacterium]